MFATSATPVALMAMDGNRSVTLLAFAWTGATAGVVLEYLPFHPPRGLVNTIFLAFGAGFLLFLPWLIDGLSGPQLWLLLGGALPYVIGALIVGSQWPDPWTDVFGYHEIWHVMVVLSAGLHYWLAMELTGVV
jgi:hemolysin III